MKGGTMSDLKACEACKQDDQPTAICASCGSLVCTACWQHGDCCRMAASVLEREAKAMKPRTPLLGQLAMFKERP